MNVRVFDLKFGVTLPLWTRSIGLIFMVGGGILVLICVAVFIIRGKGTPAVFDPPTEFVATVLMPMYVIPCT